MNYLFNSLVKYVEQNYRFGIKSVLVSFVFSF